MKRGSGLCRAVQGCAGLGWAGLGWAGLGCAGLGWAGADLDTNIHARDDETVCRDIIIIHLLSTRRVPYM